MKSFELKTGDLARILLVGENGEIFNERGRQIAQYTDRDGYKYITIGSKPHRKKMLVHRIVATTYLENPNNFPQVNHIDGNKSNNNVFNLEWITNSENQTHSRYVLGNQTGFADVAVECVETQMKYISTRDAWRDTGINYCHISECANGKRKSAGGLHWRRCAE